MPSFLIESPHSDEECIRTLENVLAMGYLTHFQWGCPEDHTGYLIIEAESRDEAIMAVPTFIRNKARIIPLTKYTAEDVRAFHTKT